MAKTGEAGLDPAEPAVGNFRNNVKTHLKVGWFPLLGGELPTNRKWVTTPVIDIDMG